MLPKSYSQAYHTLVKKLLTLQDQMNRNNPDVVIIQETFNHLQQIFSDRILSLIPQDVKPALAYRQQSIQTEIHRSLRLLGTDILFWRSSKQSETAKARLAIISDRLCSLIDYCRLMEKELETEESNRDLNK